MKHSANQKIVAVTPPGAIVDNAAFTTAAIDTLGFVQLKIIVLFGAMDIAVAAMKLQESDDSGMSGATDISGADFTGAYPSATADNTMYAFHVDLRGKKRYIDLSLTGGDGTAGTYATVIAVLSRAQECPNTAAERGFAGELFA
jgi:hypothetical protein